jgi:hypothetical protein
VFGVNSEKYGRKLPNRDRWTIFHWDNLPKPGPDDDAKTFFTYYNRKILLQTDWVIEEETTGGKGTDAKKAAARKALSLLEAGEARINKSWRAPDQTDKFFSLEQKAYNDASRLLKAGKAREDDTYIYVPLTKTYAFDSSRSRIYDFEREEKQWDGFFYSHFEKQNKNKGKGRGAYLQKGSGAYPGSKPSYPPPNKRPSPKGPPSEGPDSGPVQEPPVYY